MSFKNVIEKYLKERAAADSLFAEKFASEDKSVKECCEYIISEVRKKVSGSSNVACLSDEEVYGLAVHYYDEKDVQIEKSERDIKVAAIDEGSSAEKVRLQTVFQIPDAPVPVLSVSLKPKRKKKKEDPAQLSFF